MKFFDKMLKLKSFSITVLQIFKIFIFVLFVGLYFYTAQKDLYIDVINPDGINWHARTDAFTKGLYAKKFGDTFQSYHPGITLMWISGPLLRTFNQSDIFNKEVDDKSVFLQRDYYAKLSVVVFTTFIFIFTFILLWNMSGFKYAAIYSIILILEPFVLGMRRLYHLDYLMTCLLFLSVSLLIYFNYKSSKWYMLLLSGLCLALAALTKSSAVVVLPAIPFIFYFGNNNFFKKILSLLIFVLSVVFFIYLFTPSIWRDPIKSTPIVYEKIVFGVMDIGYEGHKEVGTSGETENTTLDKTFKNNRITFYLGSMWMRTSIVGKFLLAASLALYVLYLLGNFFYSTYLNIKNKNLPKSFTYSPESWMAFWSIVVSLGFIVALTISAKKSDRYEIVVYPFLFTVITYVLNKIKWYITLPLMIVYIAIVSYELYKIQPYYLAYSNPTQGGIIRRLFAFDDDPFGIGSYAAFQVVKQDMAKNNYNGYFTVSGGKSIKAISDGGRFSRSPSCLTDYVVVYSKRLADINNCEGIHKYSKIGSVQIAGIEYWNIYKRKDQLHQSNYE